VAKTALVDPNVAGVLSAGVTAGLAVIGVVFTSAATIFKTAANKKLALVTKADGRFDRALQTLYNAEPKVRAGSAYVLAQMALPGKERNGRYFATAFGTLCNAVRFDRDVYVNDAAFTAIATLYPSAAASRLTNLQSLKTVTEGVFAQHMAEYVVASGESQEVARVAICGATPEVLSLLERDDWQASYRKEEEFARKYDAPPADLSPEKKREMLKERAWSVRIDASLLSQISAILRGGQADMTS
jgi:hypothetical protein